jgi:hypothetical protein
MSDNLEFQATEDTLRKLGFKGTNEAFEAVLALLDIFISIETVSAIGAELSSERRHHSCGRVEALIDYKAYLIDARTQAIRKNAPDVV